MKLIFCPECHDVRKLDLLSNGITACKCGKARGYYCKDGWHVVINSVAIPIGIDNHSLKHELVLRITGNQTGNLKAWVFSNDFERITVNESL